MQNNQSGLINFEVKTLSSETFFYKYQLLVVCSIFFFFEIWSYNTELIFI